MNNPGQRIGTVFVKTEHQLSFKAFDDDSPKLWETLFDACLAQTPLDLGILGWCLIISTQIVDEADGTRFNAVAFGVDQ